MVNVTAGLEVAVPLLPQLLVTVTLYCVLAARPVNPMGEPAPVAVVAVPPAVGVAETV